MIRQFVKVKSSYPTPFSYVVGWRGREGRREKKGERGDGRERGRKRKGGREGEREGRGKEERERRRRGRKRREGEGKERIACTFKTHQYDIQKKGH